ncbi:MAG: DUF6134 family protein [Pseudomonadota bacterium]
MRVTRAIPVCCLLSLGLIQGVANACEAPASPAAFVINHETYGDIGTHTLTFACDGDQLIVNTEVDVEVKILFVTAYERQAHYREVWQGNQLIAYEARTNDGGHHYLTQAKIDGDEIVIDGLEKGVRVPLETVPSHPWNVDVIDRPTVFGQRDGRVHKVYVEATEEEAVTIGDKTIVAKKYSVRGDLERELLYAPDGTWLQWRLERDGKIITITRQ